MAHRLQSLLACFALAGLVLTAACQQRQDIDEAATDEDTLMMRDTLTMPTTPPAGMGTDTIDTLGADTMGMGPDTGMAGDTPAGM